MFGLPANPHFGYKRAVAAHHNGGVLRLLSWSRYATIAATPSQRADWPVNETDIDVYESNATMLDCRHYGLFAIPRSAFLAGCFQRIEGVSMRPRTFSASISNATNTPGF